MSAYTVPNDEPVYAVFNEAGLLLLASVTMAAASRIIDEQQSAAEVDPRWLGDMRICVVRRPPASSPAGVDRNGHQAGGPAPNLFITGGAVGFGNRYSGSVFLVAEDDNETHFSIAETIARLDEFSAEAQWHILVCCEAQGSEGMPVEVWTQCVLAGVPGARDRYWAHRRSAAV